MVFTGRAAWRRSGRQAGVFTGGVGQEFLPAQVAGVAHHQAGVVAGQQRRDVFAAGQAQVAPQVVGAQAGVREHAGDPGGRGARRRAIGVQQHAQQQGEARLGVGQALCAVRGQPGRQVEQRRVVAVARAGEPLRQHVVQFIGCQAAAGQVAVRQALADHGREKGGVGIVGGCQAQQPTGWRGGVLDGNGGGQHGWHGEEGGSMNYFKC